MGKIAEQSCTNFVGRNRLDEKPSAETPRLRLKDCVQGRARDGCDDIWPIDLRAQKQLQSVEFTESDIRDQHWGPLGDPQALCCLKGGRLERLAAPASKGCDERPHILRVGIDDEHFHWLFGPLPATQVSMHR